MKAIREVLPSRKKEKNTADNGCRLYRSIYTVFVHGICDCSGAKGYCRLIIFNLPDFLLILRKNKSDQIKIISITMHSEETTGSKFCRYVEVCKKDCYKGIYGKFMVRKPGIHGQYKAEEEKACYNKPRN